MAGPSVPEPPAPRPRISIVGGEAVEGKPAEYRIVSDLPFRTGDVAYVSSFATGQADATDFTALERHPVVPLPGYDLPPVVRIMRRAL